MTPADTAKNEAAKQAVIFCFALLGALALLPVYKRMAEHQAQALREVTDTAEQSRNRMRDALESAKRWDRVSTVLFRYGPDKAWQWAMRKGEKARAAYEAERP